MTPIEHPYVKELVPKLQQIIKVKNLFLTVS